MLGKWALAQVKREGTLTPQPSLRKLRRGKPANFHRTGGGVT